MTLKELKAKRQALAVQMRALNDSVPETRDMTGEERGKWEEMRSELQRLEAAIAREEELRGAEQDELDERRGLEREPEPRGSRTPADDARAAAHDTWLRRGMDGLDAEQRALMLERRAQGTNPAEAGGYTIATTLQTRIIESLRDFGGIASIAQLLATENGAPIAWPIANGEAEEGELIGENKAANEGDVDFGMGTLGAFTLSSKIIRVPEQLLQDTAVDIEAFLGRRIGSRIGRARSRLIVQGTGAGETADAPAQPKGLEVSANVGKATASASKFTWQEVNALIHSVDPAYRGLPKFRLAFNDSTLQSLEEMVDGNNRPLWLPGIDAARPATLLKYQYVVDQAIADIGAGKKFMFAGDFDQLVIRMIAGGTLKRLVERYAEYGQVGFLAFQRFGVVLQDLAAIKALQGKPA